MPVDLVEPEHLDYPVLCVAGGLWAVCWGPEDLERVAGRLCDETLPGWGRLPAFVVSREGQARKVIRIGARKDDRLFRLFEAPTRPKLLLECEGEPFRASPEQVAGWVGRAASALGHFESASGFGVPRSLGEAKSISELISRLTPERRGVL